METKKFAKSYGIKYDFGWFHNLKKKVFVGYSEEKARGSSGRSFCLVWMWLLLLQGG